ncbi:MAG: helix-turn-helix domain-containing protein [Patescibacteria group bacterium]|nr:helix-turn-helix domain-containing protein [Patescibacteria group bacterium]
MPNRKALLPALSGYERNLSKKEINSISAPVRKGLHPLIAALTMRRREMRLTQRQWAQRADLSQSLIGYMERGVDTRLSTLTKAAHALGLEITLVPSIRSPEI